MTSWPSLSKILTMSKSPSLHAFQMSNKSKSATNCKQLTVEGPFALVSLAQVESKFVLCASEVPQAVYVSFPLEQLIDALGMAVVGCVVEWSPLALVDCFDVGSIG